MIVTPTTDRAYLHRWMLRPAFVRMMGGRPEKSEGLEGAFGAFMLSEHRAYAVNCGGEEKGCILFQRIGDKWHLHICLATWWRDTRKALVSVLIELKAPVVAHYPERRRAVERLLDDVGFNRGATGNGWRTREFNPSPQCLGS